MGHDFSRPRSVCIHKEVDRQAVAFEAISEPQGGPIVRQIKTSGVLHSSTEAAEEEEGVACCGATIKRCEYW